MNLDSNAKVGQRRFRARTCQKSPEEEEILEKKPLLVDKFTECT